MDFFSKEDLTVFRDFGGKRISEIPNTAIDLSKSALVKTKYWADEIQKKLPRFRVEMINRWQISGYLKRYVWAKVYKPEDKNRDIFFTIGTDDDKETSLIYKLDYQFNDTSSLSVNKKKECKRFLGKFKSNRETISADALHHHNWTRLINETVNFINQNEGVYDEMVTQIWKRSSRICWNTNDWVFPSGKAGKAQQKDSYEIENGYGNEEWLFDFEKIINGYQYAFLESVLQASRDEPGEKYDILLWAIDSQDKKRYAVANIRNVEILTEEQSEFAMKQYIQNGWFDHMEQQVSDVNGNPKAFKQNMSFNIRFTQESVENLFPTELAGDNYIYKLNRYRLNRLKPDVQKILSISENNTYEFNNGKRSRPGNHNTVTFVKQAREIEMTRVHRQISDNLTAVLAIEYGAENVAQEDNIGNRSIDIVVSTSSGYIFYEIKTYRSLRTSVREALGQLLEYAYYPENENAFKLVIVTHNDHNEKEKKDCQKYIRHLRKRWNLPIYLRYFDNTKQQLCDK